MTLGPGSKNEQHYVLMNARVPMGYDQGNVAEVKHYFLTF